MTLICIYIVGILSTLCIQSYHGYSFRTLKSIRDELFEHMETLPIKFFDTHAHGDIMSIYTNDTDTLRQLLSQSLPQMINSLITMISVFISMLILNIPLAIVTLIMGGIMVITSRVITKKSSFYFRRQQKDLGIVNGFIEEMMEGCKVIKVFTHEQDSIKDFDKLNEQFFEASTNANMFANILMPIVMNIGYVYVLTATGSILAINNMAGLTLELLLLSYS